jgi:hypothetical protein
LQTFTNGTWTASWPVTPDGGPITRNHDPFTVDCSAPGSCVVAGEFSRPPFEHAALFDTLSGGTWTGVEAPLLSPLAGDFGLDSIWCGASNACVGVGWSVISNDAQYGLIEKLSPS